MKILLDVGANKGDSINTALAYAFDKIHGFEPSRDLIKVLEARFKDEPRVTIHPFGLLHELKDTILYSSGGCGASVYQNKIQYTDYSKGLRVINEEAHFEAITPWVNKYLKHELFLKLNCEASEIILLDALDNANLLGTLDHLLVEFDALRVKGLLEKAIKVKSEVLRKCPDFVDFSFTSIRVEEKINIWLSPRIKGYSK